MTVRSEIPKMDYFVCQLCSQIADRKNGPVVSGVRRWPQNTFGGVQDALDFLDGSCGSRGSTMGGAERSDEEPTPGSSAVGCAAKTAAVAGLRNVGQGDCGRGILG